MQDVYPLAEGEEPTMNEGCQDNAGFSPYLTDLSETDKPWDIHGAERDIVCQLYLNSELPQYGLRMSQCGKSLAFVSEGKDREERKFRLRQARFCRVRHCPICQWRKTLVWRARLIKALPRLQEDYPKARYILLTLTVRNCPLDELRTNVDRMNKGWGRLSKRKEFPAIGFLRSLEVTRNAETGYAHPHFHAALMVPPSYLTHGYIKHQGWVELWASCMGLQYEPIVDVRVLKGKKNKDSLIEGFLEACKYSVKPADLIADSKWLEELTIQLHKTRSISVGGLLKDYLKDSEPENLINTDEDDSDNITEDESLLIWFDWMDHIRRYKKRN